MSFTSNSAARGMILEALRASKSGLAYPSRRVKAIARSNRTVTLATLVEPESPSLAKQIADAAAQVDPNPSKEQKEAGNYRKGHVTIQGLPITIETAAGQTRSGVGASGPWSIQLKSHYGYIKRTESESDDDHIDVFVGPHPESEVVFIIDQYKPPMGVKWDEHKCILPGQKLQGSILAASKANYSGKSVKFTCFSGNTLAVTPNHPVLTLRGLVPAGCVQKGDHLLASVGECDFPVASDDKQYAPTVVEKVFCAIKELNPLGFSSELVSSLDFHGDAKFFNSNVEVVRADCKLLSDRIADASERLSESGFVRTDAKQFDLPGGCSLHSGFETEDSTSIVPASDIANANGPCCSLVGGEPRNLEFYRFGKISDVDLSALQSAANHAHIDAESMAKVLGGLSGFVSLDEIVNIEIDHYEGPVFDFQSHTGLIVVNQLIISNCMIGWPNAKDAKDAYHANYSAGWTGFGCIRSLTMDQFKHWIECGDSSKPIEGQSLTFLATEQAPSFTVRAGGGRIKPEDVPANVPAPPTPAIPLPEPKKEPDGADDTAHATMAAYLDALIRAGEAEDPEAKERAEQEADRLWAMMHGHDIYDVLPPITEMATRWSAPELAGKWVDYDGPLGGRGSHIPGTAHRVYHKTADEMNNPHMYGRGGSRKHGYEDWLLPGEQLTPEIKDEVDQWRHENGHPPISPPPQSARSAPTEEAYDPAKHGGDDAIPLPVKPGTATAKAGNLGSPQQGSSVKTGNLAPTHTLPTAKLLPDLSRRSPDIDRELGHIHTHFASAHAGKSNEALGKQFQSIVGHKARTPGLAQAASSRYGIEQNDDHATIGQKIRSSHQQPNSVTKPQSQATPKPTSQPPASGDAFASYKVGSQPLNTSAPPKPTPPPMPPKAEPPPGDLRHNPDLDDAFRESPAPKPTSAPPADIRQNSDLDDAFGMAPAPPRLGSMAKPPADDGFGMSAPQPKRMAPPPKPPIIAPHAAADSSFSDHPSVTMPADIEKPAKSMADEPAVAPKPLPTARFVPPQDKTPPTPGVPSKIGSLAKSVASKLDDKLNITRDFVEPLQEVGSRVKNAVGWKSPATEPPSAQSTPPENLKGGVVRPAIPEARATPSPALPAAQFDRSPDLEPKPLKPAFPMPQIPSAQRRPAQMTPIDEPRQPPPPRTEQQANAARIENQKASEIRANRGQSPEEPMPVPAAPPRQQDQPVELEPTDEPLTGAKPESQKPATTAEPASPSSPTFSHPQLAERLEATHKAPLSTEAKKVDPNRNEFSNFSNMGGGAAASLHDSIHDDIRTGRNFHKGFGVDFAREAYKRGHTSREDTERAARVGETIIDSHREGKKKDQFGRIVGGTTAEEDRRFQGDAHAALNHYFPEKTKESPKPASPSSAQSADKQWPDEQRAARQNPNDPTLDAKPARQSIAPPSTQADHDQRHAEYVRQQEANRPKGFMWRGVDASGKKVRGSLQAKDAEEAKAQAAKLGHTFHEMYQSGVANPPNLYEKPEADPLAALKAATPEREPGDDDIEDPVFREKDGQSASTKQKRHYGAEHALLRKQAEEAGHNPDHVQSLADQLHEEHTTFAKERNELLRHAREIASERKGKTAQQNQDKPTTAEERIANQKANQEMARFARQAKDLGQLHGRRYDDLSKRGPDGFVGGKEDAASLKGFDDITKQMVSLYPHHFRPETAERGGNHTDQLYAMLQEGDKPILSRSEAYQKALEQFEDDRYQQAAEERMYGLKPAASSTIGDSFIPFATDAALIACLSSLPSSVEYIALFNNEGWTRYHGPKGGRGWQNNQTGRIVYTASENSPGYQRRQLQSSESKARELGNKFAAHHRGDEGASKPSEADLRELADHIQALPVQSLRTLKNTLMATWGNTRRRQHMVDALTSHVRGLVNQSQDHHKSRNEKPKQRDLFDDVPEQEPETTPETPALSNVKPDGAYRTQQIEPGAPQEPEPQELWQQHPNGDTDTIKQLVAAYNRNEFDHDTPGLHPEAKKAVRAHFMAEKAQLESDWAKDDADDNESKEQDELHGEVPPWIHQKSNWNPYVPTDEDVAKFFAERDSAKPQTEATAPPNEPPEPPAVSAPAPDPEKHPSELSDQEMADEFRKHLDKHNRGEELTDDEVKRGRLLAGERLARKKKKESAPALKPKAEQPKAVAKPTSVEEPAASLDADEGTETEADLDRIIAEQKKNLPDDWDAKDEPEPEKPAKAPKPDYTPVPEDMSDEEYERLAVEARKKKEEGVKKLADFEKLSPAEKNRVHAERRAASKKRSPIPAKTEEEIKPESSHHEDLKKLIADPSVTVSDVRAKFAGMKISKDEAHALSAAMGYTPHGSGKEVLSRLQSNIEGLKMNQGRMATILGETEAKPHHERIKDLSERTIKEDLPTEIGAALKEAGKLSPKDLHELLVASGVEGSRAYDGKGELLRRLKNHLTAAQRSRERAQA